MAKKLEPATWSDYSRVGEALTALRHARDVMKQVKCPKAAEAIRLAIKSAEGAERHVARRAHESAR